MKLKYYLVTLISYIKRRNKRKLIRHSLNFKKKVGLEIGGPSTFFKLRGGFPVYLFAQKIDGVNFSTKTIWEGALSEGNNYNYFDYKTGYQYIVEATDLSKIKNESYDFVLSSHSLEHIANPIKALKEWHRVLKGNGELVLVLPDKRFTFDHSRPYTTMPHLLEDYKSQVDEHDRTHFEEIIQSHNIERDEEVESKEVLQARLEENFVNRCVHHHVFSQSLVKELLEYCGFDLLFQRETPPFHLVTIAKKNSSVPLSP